MTDTASPHTILAVRLADIGDAVLATPALAALRDAYPDARIDVLTTPVGAQVFALCPVVDHIIPFPKQLFDRPSGLLRPAAACAALRLASRLRAGRYDAAVLLHHLTTPAGTLKFRALAAATAAPNRVGLDNGRGDFLTHRATDYGFGARSELAYALDVVAALGIPAPAIRPPLVVPAEARLRADRILAEIGVREPFVIIHPSVGAYSQARGWPPERFAVVARELARRHGLDVVLVGGGDARDAAAEVSANAPGAHDLTGSTTLAETAAVLDRAALVIGADSGIAHLAAAMKTPVIAIFGPSNAAAWAPFEAVEYRVGAAAFPEAETVVVRTGIPCSPCFYTGYTLGRPEGCSTRTCLTGVTPTTILTLADHLLERAAAG